LCIPEAQTLHADNEFDWLVYVPAGQRAQFAYVKEPVGKYLPVSHVLQFFKFGSAEVQVLHSVELSNWLYVPMVHA
jgi:hypothetical protein